MKVDATALGQDLARAERIRQLRAVFDPACQILDANESSVLNAIAGDEDGRHHPSRIIAPPHPVTNDQPQLSADEQQQRCDYLP